MTLTNQDLQAIRTIVRHEVKEEVSQQLKPIDTSLQNVAKQVTQNTKLINQNAKKINRVKTTTNLILEYVEKEDTKLKNRIQTIETRLNLPSI